MVNWNDPIGKDVLCRCKCLLNCMHFIKFTYTCCRLSRRLHRRTYIAAGPNYIWHVDGNDKITPYGFGISGAIDGFSRHIIWLNVYTTNSDPAVIATDQTAQTQRYLPGENLLVMTQTALAHCIEERAVILCVMNCFLNPHSGVRH